MAVKVNIKDLISKMTLEEKASFCSGADFWHTEALKRLGIPSSMVSDGPHGLRKQDQSGDHLGVNDSIVAVCFPASCATASSFDRELIQEIGRAIGDECQAEDLSVVLGPAVNIKRSPLCGRNFEYLSEDPYLAGEMAASFISGVQSKNVGTSIKHFAANNQEHERLSGSSEVDERTLREIYFPAFETAVKKAKPWTVMCSYNQINGVFSSENEWLLNKVLRKEWGFDGYVVSDWGAVNDRVKGLLAGLDLEMPSSDGDNDRLIAEAVRKGELSEEVLDQAVWHILNIVFRYEENKKGGSFDKEADHEKAARFAEECMVLLKNEDGILPVKKGEKLAIIGEFAVKPRFQGGGSSHINSFKVSDALSAIKERDEVIYAKGFYNDRDAESEVLFEEAEQAAREADKVVIFAGLPDSFESEGYDREHMRLPDCQNKLIEKLAGINENVIVVLHNGSPVEMPWVRQVKGILEAYLGGEGVGPAVAKALYGEINPSGHLAETFPLRLQDTPCYLEFPGKGEKVYYTERFFVGYRYYDSREAEVLFPFGHGLSYTTFRIDNLRIEGEGKTFQIEAPEDFRITVCVDVTNTGEVEGKEVVQLYVSDRTGMEVRPVHELKGFEKVSLKPGETKTVTMELDYRSFAFYYKEIGDWYVPSGEFIIEVGDSSRNISAKKTITLNNTKKPPFVIKPTTTFGELAKYPQIAGAVKEKLMSRMTVFGENKQQSESAAEAITAEMEDATIRYMPIREIRSFGHITNQEMTDAVRELNELLSQTKGAE